MSRTPLAYRPNPHGWIDTSSTTKPKAPTQRPLTALRHNLGIATPPSSTLRPQKTKRKDETPLARQPNLAAFMTPPTTGPSRIAARPRGVEKVMKAVEREMVTPTTKSTSHDRRMEDFWKSSDEAGPSGTSAAATRPDGSDDDSDGIISPGGRRIRRMDFVVSQPIRSSHLPPARQISPIEIDDDNDAGSDGDMQALEPHATPGNAPPPSSDLPERTPIPSSVLRQHKRLCHQDSAQMKKIRSPWRPIGDSSPIRPAKPREQVAPLDKRKRSDERGRGVRTDKENAKRNLAVLSDEEQDDEPIYKARRMGQGEVLKALKPNVVGKEAERISKGFVTGFTSPRKRLRPASSTSDVPSDERVPTVSRHNRAQSLHHDQQRPRRSGPESPDAAPRVSSDGSSSDAVPLSPLDSKATRPARPRIPSPASQANDDCFRVGPADRPPTASPDRRLSPDGQPHHLTPRKERTKQSRHHVTPTKSKSPKRNMQNINETLFAFSPPPQPRFVAPRVKEAKVWQPVSMEAETLITWAPARWVETASSEEKAGAGEGADADAGKDVGGADGDGIARPDPTPIQHSKHNRSSSRTSATESLGPSQMSQSFPNFVHSSPTKRTRSGQASQAVALSPNSRASLPDPDDVPTLPSRQRSAIKSPSTDEKTKRTKGDAKRWNHLDDGILSVPLTSTPTRREPSASAGTAKKRKTSTKDAGQLSLAAYGYLRKTPPGRGKSGTSRNFDKAWEDEEDVKVEPEDDASVKVEQAETRSLPHRVPSGSSSRSRGLQRVPDAPYHPGFQKAGIDELKRRERERQAVGKTSRDPAGDGHDSGVAQNEGSNMPTTSSPGPSSSSQSEELFPGSGTGDDDGKDWLERIAQRRSSEFMSFRSEECI